MNLPPWAKLAVAGAITAVAIDYFLKPSISKVL